ncbi:endoplasmic reticulum chaperone BiP [Purpureocillium lavendulum]|uniref:Casein kinase I isoform delta n=1 Tax=Purpureocillium lavendulum TaxID=1247861 RepID=A0AB34FBP6_9HYPO|nr:casein kinase I isoform delta [Purpureocillium lavendulum]KAJ6436104.1 endoplasmic reticulum chaperone BiP [Purpureocillium lavendulum]
MADETYTIGVDFGTTYFCVFVNGQPFTIEYGDVQRSRVRVSEIAWGLASAWDIPDAQRPHLTFVKRILGRGSQDGRLASDVSDIALAEMGEHGARYAVHGQFVEPEEVAAFILGKIKAAVENTFRGQTLRHMVMTVPAHFTQRQRQATLDSAAIARFDPAVIRLVEEPVAGTVDFVETVKVTPKIRRLVVLDIGGGTTDASLLSFEALEHKHAYGILATSGDNHLGGFDFDNALRRLVLSKAKAETQDVDFQRLVLECESKKRALSTSDSVVIEIPFLQGHAAPQAVRITRAEFEEWSKPLHESINGILDDLIDQRVDAKTPDVVLLVGGACIMPSIRSLCERVFAGAKIGTADPERSIARGASLIAANPKIQIKAVLPRSVGIEVYGTNGKLGTERVIERNSALPRRCHHRLQTSVPNQTSVRFRLMEGEDIDSDNNIEVGDFEITGILPCPQGTPIDVVMAITSPGNITVSAKVQGKGGYLTVKPTPRVERHRLHGWEERTRRRLGFDIEDTATGRSEAGHAGTPASEATPQPTPAADEEADGRTAGSSVSTRDSDSHEQGDSEVASTTMDAHLAQGAAEDVDTATNGCNWTGEPDGAFEGELPVSMNAGVESNFAGDDECPGDSRLITAGKGVATDGPVENDDRVASDEEIEAGEEADASGEAEAGEVDEPGGADEADEGVGPGQEVGSGEELPGDEELASHDEVEGGEPPAHAADDGTTSKGQMAIDDRAAPTQGPSHGRALRRRPSTNAPGLGAKRRRLSERGSEKGV